MSNHFNDQGIDLGDVKDVYTQQSQGMKWVTAAKYHLGEKVEDLANEQERIEVADFGDNPVARISVSGGLTRNMGDFNSVRIDVGISLPCLASEEHICYAYDRARQLVAAMVEEQAKAAGI